MVLITASLKFIEFSTEKTKQKNNIKFKKCIHTDRNDQSTKMRLARKQKNEKGMYEDFIYIHVAYILYYYYHYYYYLKYKTSHKMFYEISFKLAIRIK